MTPRLEACYFSAVGSDGRWTRLARVLDWSARQHCPAWHVRVEAIEPPPVTSRIQIRTYETNTQKLDRWAEIVATAADGERLLLIDADTMIVRPIDEIWQRDFDVAYTTKRARFPINGGVVFLRVSPRVRTFLQDWADANRRLLADSDPEAGWRYTHGGVNQASLAQLLTTAQVRGLHLVELSCAEWNCEDSGWATFDPARTRILHIKSALRQACLSGFPPEPWLLPLRDIWRAAERQAKAALTPA